ncbi:glycosyltransferase [Leptotrichia sp. OH3620_COT-345]|uniref:glycosyltransferase family 2 protein n=1 Tax=Leptotrichia sp. OH3620_COT-345 TaxID=2491048 RepID=UPI000F654CDD|nr:glycosyltransferase [Leptotrichia sp. OH3620_COT-345]RRD40774.1 glycosyltransferase [Leptotrichia sp. OH3620_COT-345]
MKLSIIIPVYNTEKYIEQCIKSVLALKGIEKEIIVINDGSTDKSLCILEKYEKEYKEIRVILQENQGASAARNEGIKASGGDYIYFLDSDDWIESESFEKVVKDIEKEYENNQEIDIVVGKERAYSEFTKTGSLDERIPRELKGKVISGKEYMIRSINDKFWNVRLPIYLYRRKLITDNGILFPEGRRSNEDEVFSIDIFRYGKKLKIVDEIFGYYRAREGSIMSVLNIRHAEDIFRNAKELLEKYKNEEDYEMKKIIFYMIKRYYKSSMKKSIQCGRKDIFEKIYKEFKKDCKKYLFRIKEKSYENIELYIIYYTKDMIFSIKENLKKYRKGRK